MDNGFEYIIQHGSFVGNKRLEFDFAIIEIKNPYAEPYDNMLPDIPEQYNIPAPAEKGDVEKYLPYIMTGDIQENEEYTYGERLCKVLSHINELHETYESQIDQFIQLLKETPKTNQAILQVAQPDDYLLDEPPCLRHIDMRIKNNRLIFYPYFRS